MPASDFTAWESRAQDMSFAELEANAEDALIAAAVCKDEQPDESQCYRDEAAVYRAEQHRRRAARSVKHLKDES